MENKSNTKDYVVDKLNSLTTERNSWTEHREQLDKDRKRGNQALYELLGNCLALAKECHEKPEYQRSLNAESGSFSERKALTKSLALCSSALVFSVSGVIPGSGIISTFHRCCMVYVSSHSR